MVKGCKLIIRENLVKVNIVDVLMKLSLQWRHNGRDSVSNHQTHDCLPNRLFRRRSKKTSKLRVTGLCAGNSPGTGEFPSQMASYAEIVSIWWRHHVWANDTPRATDLCWINCPSDNTATRCYMKSSIALVWPAYISCMLFKCIFTILLQSWLCTTTATWRCR